jgi:hypothetical protein
MNASHQAQVGEPRLGPDSASREFRFTSYPYAQPDLIEPNLPQGPIALGERTLSELLIGFNQHTR